MVEDGRRARDDRLMRRSLGVTRVEGKRRVPPALRDRLTPCEAAAEYPARTNSTPSDLPGDALKIPSVQFRLSAGNARECPQEEIPEIALSGRSNVGKSSLLNSLFGRRDLAKVSGTPGKTRRLNYFLVDERFHIVDLPGYGYAKAAAESRGEWSGMMQEYLRRRRQLVAMIQLVDSRHEPSHEDREMVRWLVDEGLPFCLVATKVDKLRHAERQRRMGDLLGTLELPADQPLVPYSSHKGEGRKELLGWIEATLGG